MKATFKKKERLRSKKVIGELFELGKSFYSKPFLVIWEKTNHEQKYPAQMAVSVSKKLFKRTVYRNLLKRRIREAYRLNKHLLFKFLENKNFGVIFIFVYREKQIMDYHSIEQGMISALQQLRQNL